jgi:hypothetical protein
MIHVVLVLSSLHKIDYRNLFGSSVGAKQEAHESRVVSSHFSSPRKSCLHNKASNKESRAKDLSEQSPNDVILTKPFPQDLIQ